MDLDDDATENAAVGPRDAQEGDALDGSAILDQPQAILKASPMPGKPDALRENDEESNHLDV